MQHQAGRQGARRVRLPFRQGEAYRLHHAKTLAVLGQAVHIQHLLERQSRAQALQFGFLLGTPGTLHPYFALDHRFAGQQPYLLCSGCACNVQHRRRRAGKSQLPFGRDQLIQHRNAAHALQGVQLLLNAAIGQCSDHLRFVLGAHGRHQPHGTPHLHAARIDHPAVEVFGLTLHHRRPGRKVKFRQFQLLCKGQFLFGLAETCTLLALIIDRTAQIALQCQPARLQLLLQDDRLCKAFDQFEHRRQIVRDQDLGLQRELCLDGAHRARLRHRVPKDLQFHARCSFPCPLLPHGMRPGREICSKKLPPGPARRELCLTCAYSCVLLRMPNSLRSTPRSSLGLLSTITCIPIPTFPSDTTL